MAADHGRFTIIPPLQNIRFNRAYVNPFRTSDVYNQSREGNFTIRRFDEVFEKFDDKEGALAAVGAADKYDDGDVAIYHDAAVRNDPRAQQRPQYKARLGVTMRGLKGINIKKPLQSWTDFSTRCKLADSELYSFLTEMGAGSIGRHNSNLNPIIVNWVIDAAFNDRAAPQVTEEMLFIGINEHPVIPLLMRGERSFQSNGRVWYEQNALDPYLKKTPWGYWLYAGQKAASWNTRYNPCINGVAAHGIAYVLEGRDHADLFFQYTRGTYVVLKHASNPSFDGKSLMGYPKMEHYMMFRYDSTVMCQTRSMERWVAWVIHEYIESSIILLNLAQGMPMKAVTRVSNALTFNAPAIIDAYKQDFNVELDYKELYNMERDDIEDAFQYWREVDTFESLPVIIRNLFLLNELILNKACLSLMGVDLRWYNTPKYIEDVYSFVREVDMNAYFEEYLYGLRPMYWLPNNDFYVFKQLVLPNERLTSRVHVLDSDKYEPAKDEYEVHNVPMEQPAGLRLRIDSYKATEYDILSNVDLTGAVSIGTPIMGVKPGIVAELKKYVNRDDIDVQKYTQDMTDLGLPSIDEVYSRENILYREILKEATVSGTNNSLAKDSDNFGIAVAIINQFVANNITLGYIGAIAPLVRDKLVRALQQRTTLTTVPQSRDNDRAMKQREVIFQALGTGAVKGTVADATDPSTLRGLMNVVYSDIQVNHLPADQMTDYLLSLMEKLIAQTTPENLVIFKVNHGLTSDFMNRLRLWNVTASDILINKPLGSKGFNSEIYVFLKDVRLITMLDDQFSRILVGTPAVVEIVNRFKANFQNLKGLASAITTTADITTLSSSDSKGLVDAGKPLPQLLRLQVRHLADKATRSKLGTIMTAGRISTFMADPSDRQYSTVYIKTIYTQQSQLRSRAIFGEYGRAVDTTILEKQIRSAVIDGRRQIYEIPSTRIKVAYACGERERNTLRDIIKTGYQSRKLKNGFTILDIGAGPRMENLTLLQEYPTAKMVCIDPALGFEKHMHSITMANEGLISPISKRVTLSTDRYEKYTGKVRDDGNVVCICTLTFNRAASTKSGTPAERINKEIDSFFAAMKEWRVYGGAVTMIVSTEGYKYDGYINATDGLFLSSLTPSVEPFVSETRYRQLCANGSQGYKVTNRQYKEDEAQTLLQSGFVLDVGNAGVINVLMNAHRGIAFTTSEGETVSLSAPYLSDTGDVLPGEISILKTWNGIVGLNTNLTSKGIFTLKIEDGKCTPKELNDVASDINVIDDVDHLRVTFVDKAPGTKVMSKKESGSQLLVEVGRYNLDLRTITQVEIITVSQERILFAGPQTRTPRFTWTYMMSLGGENPKIVPTYFVPIAVVSTAVATKEEIDQYASNYTPQGDAVIYITKGEFPIMVSTKHGSLPDNPVIADYNNMYLGVNWFLRLTSDAQYNGELLRINTPWQWQVSPAGATFAIQTAVQIRASAVPYNSVSSDGYVSLHQDDTATDAKPPAIKCGPDDADIIVCAQSRTHLRIAPMTYQLENTAVTTVRLRWQSVAPPV